MRRDIAEFYRISGGKLRNIAIVSDGSRRANAGGIGQPEGMEVRATGNFNKETLWHELAHHLEADPAAKQAANDFLIKRRESETVYSLRSLTGNKGYGSDEIAYKDAFINPYIGKVYQDQVTEVWSMGVQYLSNPELAASFIAKDPEMASLIAGYLQAELSPAMKALQQVQGMTAGSNQAKRDAAEKQYQDAVKRLSSGIEIVKDSWFNDLEQEDRDNLHGNYALRDKEAVYLGSWGDYHVFSGKFKSRVTKRTSKGYAVCYTLRTGTFLIGETDYFGRSGQRRQIPNCYPVHAELPVVKAAMRVSRDNYQDDFNSVIWRLFNDYTSDNGKMIELANQIIGVPG